ncbi:MAG: hypothetical protein V1799_06315 [bacterium]
MEAILTVIGLIITIIIYFAGIKQGQRQERDRRKHERAIEQDKRLHELASKAADEYVVMARSNRDNGPHALATLALQLLGSDMIIREALKEMHLRSGHDPWLGKSKFVDDLDLVKFFEYVHQSKIDFFKISVEDIAQRVRMDGGIRTTNTA